MSNYRASSSGSMRSKSGYGSRSSYGSSHGGGSSRGYGSRNSGGFSSGSRGRKYNKVLSVSDLLYLIEKEKNKSAQSETEQVFTPTNTFEGFQILPQIKSNIKYKGYIQPTPIQDQAIPAVLAGRDLIGSAATGTGKTAAFLIPLIDKVAKKRTEKVLIVTPTRELANQIYEEFRAFSYGTSVYAALCIGGTNIYRQKSELMRNPAFVIGTPGRIKDLTGQHAIDLSKFNNVVLDETDQMVDIGFVDEIKFFISLLPKVRQSLFFSATMPSKVVEILNSFVQNPVVVNVKTQETAEHIKQGIVKVERTQNKLDVLHNLLLQDGFEKVLIFGRTKWGVQRIADDLQARGHKTGAIHGDKRQSQRQQILTKFKRNEITILLATDVASRGLDIKNVSHVINYDMPETIDDYIHRIGRTGRADKMGVALTLID